MKHNLLPQGARREVVWLFGLSLLIVGLLAGTNLISKHRSELRPIYIMRGAFTSELAFLPKSELLVASGTNLRFYDSKTGTLAAAWGTPPDRASNLAVAPDGSQVAVSDYNGTINLWNTKSATKTKVLKAHDSISHLDFSPDSRWLVSGNWRKNFKAGDIFLWDARSGKLVRRYPPQPSFVGDFEFSPDNRHFATVGGKGDVLIWDIKHTKPVHFMKVPKDSLLTVAYSPDGKRLATGGWSQNVQIWDTQSGALLRTVNFPREAKAEVRALVFFPDSRKLCVAASKSELVVLNSEDAQVLNSFPGYEDLIGSVALSPDTKLLATATFNRVVRVWKLK